MVTYRDLLTDELPAVIETEAEYDHLRTRYSELLRKGPERSSDETRFMRLLGLLVRDYDQRHAGLQEDVSPAEALLFLLEHSGKTRDYLVPVFGSKSHVSEALSGRRPISSLQARKLGTLFAVKPGLFIDRTRVQIRTTREASKRT